MNISQKTVGGYVNSWIQHMEIDLKLVFVHTLHSISLYINPLNFITKCKCINFIHLRSQSLILKYEVINY